MNSRFQTLLSSLDNWSTDASDVLSGEAVVFDDFPPTEDHIYTSLIVPGEYDATAQEIVQVLCTAFSTLLQRLVEDHLPGGEYYSPSDDLKDETKSVPKTNTVSECDFAKLDRLLREKPNAKTV